MSLIHTIARTFTYAGTVEYPREAEPLYDHLGDTLEAGDGTPTNVYRSNKRRWEFNWESPRPEVVTRWRDYYAARTNQTLIDPFGQVYVVMIPARQFRYRAVYLPNTSAVAGTTYKLTVQVWEV